MFVNLMCPEVTSGKLPCAELIVDEYIMYKIFKVEVDFREFVSCEFAY